MGTIQRAEGITANISGCGAFVALPIRLKLHTPFRMKIALPSGLTKIPVRLDCSGRVMRLSQSGESRGIGATIENYEFRPDLQKR